MAKRPCAAFSPPSRRICRKRASSKKKIELRDLYIDTGYPKEALEEKVSVGDAAGFFAPALPLENRMVTSKALDDRICAFSILRAAETVDRAKLTTDVCILLSGGEEIGYIGARTAAFALCPDAAVALDVTNAHMPGGPRHKKDVQLGNGPVISYSATTSRAFTRALTDTAEAHGIPYAVAAEPGRDGDERACAANHAQRRADRFGVRSSALYAHLRGGRFHRRRGKRRAAAVRVFRKLSVRIRKKGGGDMKTLLEKYCAAFAPSGQEDELREMIASDVAPYADELRTDRSGSLIAFKKGRKRRAEKLLFSAHMDEVGFMVTHISEEGFAYFGTIGGIDPRVTAGKRVLLGDKRLPGVIAAKAIHMQKPEERGVPAPIEEMFIDIGALSEENTKSLVSVGDCAVFAPNFETFGDGFIKSKAIDDRFGCALLVRLLQSDLEYDAYFAFCTAEEVGCRGAMTVAQAVGADTVVVLEATTAGDIPGAPKSRVACRVGGGAVVSFMDGGTIYPRGLVDAVMRLAEEKGIRAQLKELVAGGNDASAYQRAAAGARVLALSAPVRYIHSACSVAKYDDLEQVFALASALAERSF